MFYMDCNRDHYKEAIVFDTQDHVYLSLIERRNRLDKHFAETREKASKMDHIDGYTSPWAFIRAVREEYDEMRAEIDKAIEDRIEALK
jgi:hypothetical protein